MFSDKEIQIIKELVQYAIDEKMHSILNEGNTQYEKLVDLINIKLKMDSR